MSPARMTPPERALRYGCALILLLASAATIAAWDTVAVALFVVAIVASPISITWEYLRERHRRKLLERFYPEADDFLDRLFRDRDL